MKEKYIEFIKQFKENSLYENNSIDDNELFGIKEFLSDGYLNNNFYLEKNIFIKCKNELEKILFKYNFIFNFYKEYENRLKNEIEKLDKEYFELDKVSSLGNKFFLMKALKEYYNYIIPYDVIYKKNLIFTDESVIKSNETLEEINFTIKEEKSSVFVYFNKGLSNIQDIFINLYNEFTISIFGIKENGSLENIVSNKNSSDKLFINTSPTLFKGIFITGIGNINGYIKELKIYEYTKGTIRKNGIIIYKLKDLKKINKIFYGSNSGTKIYKLKTEEYNEFAKILNTDNFSSILNENKEIQKNLEYDLNGETDIIIVEVFNQNTNISDKLNFFGKAKNEN